MPFGKSVYTFQVMPKPSKSTDKKSRKVSVPKTRERLSLETLLIKIINLMKDRHPNQLNFSNVSRWTKVPRSTLYYYFGKNFNLVLVEAVRYAMKEFIQVYDAKSLMQYDDWTAFQKKRMRRSFEIAKNYPWALEVYIKYRSYAGEIGERIRELEEIYIKGQIEAWQYFYGVCPEKNKLLLSSYIKLGLLLGLGIHHEHWFRSHNDLEDVIDLMTAQIHKLLS